MALDYILAHPKEEYLETAQAKRRYFVETLKVPESIFTQGTDQEEAMTFGDLFPISVSRTASESALAVAFKVAQAQLGHSHMATTLEVYTHASGSAQRDAVNMLADQLFPNVPSWMVVEIPRRKRLK